MLERRAPGGLRLPCWRGETVAEVDTTVAAPHLSPLAGATTRALEASSSARRSARSLLGSPPRT
jgi:hypothetical protein